MKIVSTRVGGIPEVLPPELIILTEPNVPCKNTNFNIKITMCFNGKINIIVTILAILQGLNQAINQVNNKLGVPPIECHLKVQSLYNWMNIAKRTEIVYNMVSLEPPKSLGKQLRRLIYT